MTSAVETGLFTNGEQPWHDDGIVKKEKLYDIEEALEGSGLNWTASKRRLAMINEQEEYVQLPDHYAVVRDTDNQLLNPCVSSGYEILQNNEAFRFFEPFLHEQDCYINSAISLHNGKKICILAEIEDNKREVVPGDNVQSYILLATSHDGSLGTSVRFTNVRVVCQNTLNVALAQKDAFRAVRHTAGQYEQLANIQASVNLFKRSFEEEVSLYKQLANKPMTLDSTRDYLERLFENDLKAAAKRLDKPLAEVGIEDARMPRKCLENFLFSDDLQMDGVINTAWAAFNGVTEAVKTRSSDQDNRLDSIWFGSDSKFIKRAKELALAF